MHTPTHPLACPPSLVLVKRGGLTALVKRDGLTILVKRGGDARARGGGQRRGGVRGCLEVPRQPVALRLREREREREIYIYI